MIAATYLLLALGALGATDVLLYHSIAHGIRHHADSRAELIIHSLRGPTYAVLFLLVPNFALHGLWFWALMALFAIDLAISIADFAIERHSRAFFGGLPSGEYVLHILMAILFGALVTSVCFEAGEWASLPTQIGFQPAAVPLIVRIALAVMAIGVFVSGAQDALAAIRLQHTKTASQG